MNGWSGRRCVIWGADSDIGAAVAREVAARTSEVLLIDHQWNVSGDLAAGRDLPPHPLDPGRDGSRAAAEVARRVDRRWGGLDALIDCSSAMETWPASEDTADLFASVLIGNVVPAWLHTRALTAALATGRLPAIVFLGSIDGDRGNPQVPAYSAGKAGIESLTRTMAGRLGPLGIRVNCVAAAGVRQIPAGSGAVRRTLGDAAAATRLTPLGRMPTAGEIANVAVFLAGDEASAMTGTVTPVDCGRSAPTPGTW